MGGFGSGKHSGRRTTGSMMALDVRKVHDITSSTIAVEFTYEGKTTTIKLDWTPCTYGGARAWWVCSQCRRRVAILYLGNVLACRHCHCLAYQSDRTKKSHEPYDRSNAVRATLGWGGGCMSPIGEKPKGMHWATYSRLLSTLHRHQLDALGFNRVWIDKTMRKLDKVTEGLERY